VRAAEGTRTLDLLHGKERRAARQTTPNDPKPPVNTRDAGDCAQSFAARCGRRLRHVWATIGPHDRAADLPLIGPHAAELGAQWLRLR
jgi:hypothetical protein